MPETLLVLIFAVYCIAAGVRWRVTDTSAADAFVTDRRSLPWWRSGISLAASLNAAHVPWLAAGLIATGGAATTWGFWAASAVLIGISFLYFGPWRATGVSTDAELSELRYGGKAGKLLRRSKAVFYGGLLAPLLIATVLLSALRIFDSFLPWHEWLPGNFYTGLLNLIHSSGAVLSDGITGRDSLIHTTDALITAVLLAVLVGAYAIPGGFRGVTRTDVVQLLLAVAAALALVSELTGKAGGITRLADETARIYGHRTASRLLALAPGWREILEVALPVAAVYGVIASGADGTGFATQRALASRSPLDARRAGILAAWILIGLLSVVWLLIGVALLVLYPYPEYAPTVPGFMRARELLVAAAIDEHVSPGKRGLILVGLLAALISTIDALVNWGASYWSNDLWIRKRSGRLGPIMRGRVASAALLAGGILIATALPSLRTAWNTVVVASAGTAGVLALRWFWRGLNAYGELASLVITVTTSALLLGYSEAEQSNPVVAPGVFLASLTVAIAASHIGRASNSAEFERFERLAFGSGRAKAHLKGALKATAVCSLSLLFVLLGTVKLLLASPTEPVFLAVISILLGLGLLPFWLRAVR